MLRDFAVATWRVLERHHTSRTGAVSTGYLGRPDHLALLKEARQIIEEWRCDYNASRPHSSLNGLTPVEFAIRPDQGHNRNRIYL
jgi:transposase InsO family protein